MTSNESVLTDVTDGVAVLTLNQPDRLNAVDVPMVRRLATELRRLDDDSSVRVIAITGAGRGFCSGANLAPATAGDDETGGTLAAVGDVLRLLRRGSTPTVGLINGVAAGVGCSLAIACDYILAAESAAFMLAFTKIGLMPDGGSTALVAASVGRARALRMALTAEKVTATKALEWGLIAEVVPDADFSARSQELTSTFAASAPLAMSATRRAINDVSLAELDEALAREEEGQTALRRSADFAEGAAAFREKRPARFTGA